MWRTGPLDQMTPSSCWNFTFSDAEAEQAKREALEAEERKRRQAGGVRLAAMGTSRRHLSRS